MGEMTSREQSRYKELGGSHMHQKDEVNSGNLEAFRSTLAITTQTKKLTAKKILALIIIWNSF